jgi:hypothetical protein
MVHEASELAKRPTTSGYKLGSGCLGLAILLLGFLSVMLLPFAPRSVQLSDFRALPLGRCMPWAFALAVLIGVTLPPSPQLSRGRDLLTQILAPIGLFLCLMAICFQASLVMQQRLFDGPQASHGFQTFKIARLTICSRGTICAELDWADGELSPLEIDQSLREYLESRNLNQSGNLGYCLKLPVDFSSKLAQISLSRWPYLSKDALTPCINAVRSVNDMSKNMKPFRLRPMNF